jgi:ketol-acid reductoisomerase
LIYEGGIANMRHSISDTAEYGDLTRGPRIVDDRVKQNMKQILSEIQKDKGAKFAKEWLEEAKNGYPNFTRLREEAKKHPIEETGKKLRSMMKFLKKK